jgi:hypothetical protein
MNRPLLVNDNLVDAQIEYVTNSEFAFLKQWKRALGNDTDSKRVDAVNLATLACKRYKAHEPVEYYATRPEDIEAFVRINPMVEVANFLLMRCNSFPESNIVGLAHVRRSWCNNLILDYLVSHPWIVSPPQGYHTIVNGVGLGLMYFVCKLAVEHECEVVWGETTESSWSYYKRIFDLVSVRDMLYVPRDKIVEYLNGQDQKWREKQQQHGR